MRTSSGTTRNWTGKALHFGGPGKDWILKCRLARREARAAESTTTHPIQMNSEQRKTASETLLHKRGIRLNLGLPEIETNEEVRLRSGEEVLRRLIALWALTGTAAEPASMRFRDYVLHHDIASWLSAAERAFVLADVRTEQDCLQFSWKRECLFFLAWSAGLVKRIDIPSGPSDLETILQLFPQGTEAPAALQAALQIRSKNLIMDWADLLYRLHWAVRHAALIGKENPASLDGGVVREWHQAVNWMTGYEEEDDWDRVQTDT